jgi:hypothetical protein
MKYILVNIGCIECGVSSNIVGVFTDKLRAENIRNFLIEFHHWREGGDNHYFIFEMPQDNDIHAEYHKVLKDNGFED